LQFDPYRLYLEGPVENNHIFVKECNESTDTVMAFVSITHSHSRALMQPRLGSSLQPSRNSLP